jgi:two-component system, OmpR family, phosphate regulon sensor histidine kinase PhoR
MHQGLRDEIRRIIVIACFAILIGLLTHHLAAAILVAGFLYTCWLLHQTRKFYLWLEHNMEQQPPDSGGIWGDIFDGMYRMRQSNIKTRQQMQQELDRVQGFTSALQSGIVLLSSQGNISWWNQSAERLLGFKPQFDTGKPIVNLLRDPNFIAFFQSERYGDVITIPSPINTAQLIEIQMTVYGNNEKLLAVQDITRLKQLEQMRKDFVANVSHELRTPLTVINGYLEPMVEHIDKFDSVWQQPIQKINTQAQRMTDIVNDLGTLSRLDNNDVTDKKDLVNTGKLIEKIVDDTRQINADKNITIHVSGKPFNLLGSETELQSCFSNLVYNAAKYARPDNIRIEIEYSRDETGGHIAFRDNGIGIDPVHFPRLTERFYRVDSSHSRKTGGTGLGLAIVKHVLIRHSGQLGIESAPGKGSTFTCHFNKERIAE